MVLKFEESIPVHNDGQVDESAEALPNRRLRSPIATEFSLTFAHTADPHYHHSVRLQLFHGKFVLPNSHARTSPKRKSTVLLGHF